MAKDVKIIDGKLSRFGKLWGYAEVPMNDGFSRKKPIIDEAKILDIEEKAVVEHTLKIEGRKLIFETLKPKKNDYINDCDRGTVELNLKHKNYSFHKIDIPDYSLLRECNFTQAKPHSKAINGKYLVFINCNLNNVEIDPTWTVQNCLTIHSRKVKKDNELIDNIEHIVYEHQVEKKGVFETVKVYKEPANEINIKKIDTLLEVQNGS